MLDFLLVLLVGWPAIIITIILTVIGLLRRDYRFLTWAAILAFPYSWYLSGFPSVRSFIFLLPLFPFAAAFAMYRKHEMMSWILAVPFFLAILLLLFVILAQ